MPRVPHERERVALEDDVRRVRDAERLDVGVRGEEVRVRPVARVLHERGRVLGRW